MTSLPLGWSLIVLAACGCGPSIRYQTRSTAAYTASERCSQGPLEVRMRAEGARWGEGLEVWACSPRAIGGRWILEVDGQERSSGDYASSGWSHTPGGGSEYSSRQKPDNQRCVAAPEEVASAGPSATGAAPSGPAGSAGPSGPARAAPRQAERTERLVPVRANDDNCPKRVPIALWDHESHEPEAFAGLRAGGEIKLVLWSEMPNDFEGVTFFAVHRVGHPSVAEAKWVEHLRKERADRERRERAEQPKIDARNAFCDTHHADESCWGEGGYEGWVRRRSAPRAAATPSEPRPVDRPPPPARAENPPPRPSLHAEWVPGRWEWSGLEYRWMAGLWRVPEEDRRTGQTAEAPAPPPAVRSDAVPNAPAAGWVWTPGYWAWGGAQWIWVAGSWQLPPAGATWRPSRWVITGPRVRLDPGGWIR